MRKVTIRIIAFALVCVMILPGLVSGQRRGAVNPSSEGRRATFQIMRRQSRFASPGGGQRELAAQRLGPGIVAGPARLKSEQPLYMPNEVLIQLDRRDNDAAKSEVAKALGTPRFQEVKKITTTEEGDLILAPLPSGLSVDSAISRMRLLQGVRFAQKNWIYTIQQSVSDDQEYVGGNLWGMYGDDQPTQVGPAGTTNQYGCQAEKAWDAGNTGSRDVFVGVIDEGVQYTHPDLAANIWANPREIAGNGRDDDHNGRVDDIHGWDFFNDDNSVYDGGNTGDVDQHGTHVAGTIGAVGRNVLGVVGVNWNVTIIPAKFLGSTGGTTDKAVEAIDYFVALRRDQGVNIVAINASWGGGGYDLALHEAIKRAARQGILFIAAAGNGDSRGRPINTDNRPFYPACYDTTISTVGQGGTEGVDYDSIISVAAIKAGGEIAEFSNYGIRTVDLGAPGYEITSTWPNDTYQSASGTSMAAPHVTGAVALYASIHRGVAAGDIKREIIRLATATPTSSMNGKTVSGGRLNVSGF